LNLACLSARGLDPPTDQLLASGGRARTTTSTYTGLKNPVPTRRQPWRIVAIGLVGRERLEGLIACRLSMHSTGRPRRLGAFANSSAIAFARRRRLGPIGCGRLKSEETGEAHPAASARIRYMRRRGPLVPANNCRRRQSPPQADRIDAGWKRRHCMDYLLASISRWTRRPQPLRESSCSTSGPTTPLIELDRSTPRERFIHFE
jgi:hypothetical protein